eukprot:8245377-Prorocentrum_lima.AAC.1
MRPNTVWNIRRAVHGMEGSPGLWHEERDKVLSYVAMVFAILDKLETPTTMKDAPIITAVYQAPLSNDML